MTAGVLYGVGVGPGDPELMTLKAHRLISEAEVVAYLAADTLTAQRPSRARRIAAAAIAPNAMEIEIRTPMRADRSAAQGVYDRAATDLAAELEQGRSVVFLCEGDPLFYGSFMYMLARLGHRFPVEITPGVASPMAAAAAIRQPLAARDASFAVIPCHEDLNLIETRLRHCDAAALMKLGRHLPEIRALIERLGLTDRAFYVEGASEADQHAAPLREAPKVAPYFSMILITSDDRYTQTKRRHD